LWQLSILCRKSHPLSVTIGPAAEDSIFPSEHDATIAERVELMPKER